MKYLDRWFLVTNNAAFSSVPSSRPCLSYYIPHFPPPFLFLSFCVRCGFSNNDLGVQLEQNSFNIFLCCDKFSFDSVHDIRERMLSVCEACLVPPFISLTQSLNVHGEGVICSLELPVLWQQQATWNMLAGFGDRIVCTRSEYFYDHSKPPEKFYPLVVPSSPLHFFWHHNAGQLSSGNVKPFPSTWWEGIFAYSAHLCISGNHPVFSFHVFPRVSFFRPFISHPSANQGISSANLFSVDACFFFFL